VHVSGLAISDCFIPGQSIGVVSLLYLCIHLMQADFLTVVFFAQPTFDHFRMFCFFSRPSHLSSKEVAEGWPLLAPCFCSGVPGFQALSPVSSPIFLRVSIGRRQLSERSVALQVDCSFRNSSLPADSPPGGFAHFCGFTSLTAVVCGVSF